MRDYFLKGHRHLNHCNLCHAHFAYFRRTLLLLNNFFFREMAVKFNDYFEFPREFDIYPYTAAGLAKIEGTKLWAYLFTKLHSQMQKACTLNSVSG